VRSATDIHPKVAAGGTVGVIVTAVVSLLLVFGVAVPAGAIAPVVVILTILAAYIKKSKPYIEYVGS